MLNVCTFVDYIRSFFPIIADELRLLFQPYRRVIDHVT